MRVEDIDPPREVAGSADSILRDLAAFGLHHDGKVLYQSTRTPAYRQATETLLAAGQAFYCSCSRKDLPPSGVYPGTCRNGPRTGRSAHAIRLKVPDRHIEFNDRIQGRITENLAESVGDFVIWRADDLPAYQLAVVVDDAFQGVDSVVRGADLLDSTPRQIWLQHCLDLPTPRYAHVPLAVDRHGAKLSKRDQSDPVSALPAPDALKEALRFLGQQSGETDRIEEILSFAVSHWSIERIPQHQAARTFHASAGSATNHL
jgi:glutamyl-Q tRNA(Asp) synthetase